VFGEGLVSKASRRILLVTFAAHRVRHLCALLTLAVERGVFAGPVQMISVNGMLSPTKQSTAIMAAAISLHLAWVFLSNASDRIQAASLLRRARVTCPIDAGVGLASEVASWAASCCQMPTTAGE
jgi:hypothetical protein